MLRPNQFLKLREGWDNFGAPALVCQVLAAFDPDDFTRNLVRESLGGKEPRLVHLGAREVPRMAHDAMVAAGLLSEVLP